MIKIMVGLIIGMLSITSMANAQWLPSYDDDNIDPVELFYWLRGILPPFNWTMKNLNLTDVSNCQTGYALATDVNGRIICSSVTGGAGASNLSVIQQGTLVKEGVASINASDGLMWVDDGGINATLIFDPTKGFDSVTWGSGKTIDWAFDSGIFDTHMIFTQSPARVNFTHSVYTENDFVAIDDITAGDDLTVIDRFNVYGKATLFDEIRFMDYSNCNSGNALITNSTGYINCGSVGGGGNSTEEVQDAIGSAFNFTLNYDDAANEMGVNQSWINDTIDLRLPLVPTPNNSWLLFDDDYIYPNWSSNVNVTNNLTVDGNVSVNGSIGVGTPVPEADIHIQRDGNATLIIESDINDLPPNGVVPQLILKSDGGLRRTIVGAEGQGNKAFQGSLSNAAYVMAAHPEGDDLQFATGGQMAMTILEDSQFIGVNTNAPESELHVEGTFRIEGLNDCDTLDTSSNGTVICGSDDVGSNAVLNNSWLLVDNGKYIYPNESWSQNVNVTGNLTVDGNTTLRGQRTTFLGNQQRWASIYGMNISDVLGRNIIVADATELLIDHLDVVIGKDIYTNQTIILRNEDQVVAAPSNTIQHTKTMNFTTIISTLNFFNAAGKFRYKTTPFFGIGPTFFKFNEQIIAEDSDLILSGTAVYSVTNTNTANGVIFTRNDALPSFQDIPSFTVGNGGTFAASSGHLSYLSRVRSTIGANLNRTTGFKFQNIGSGDGSTIGQVEHQTGLHIEALYRGRTSNRYLYIDGYANTSNNVGSFHRPNIQFGSIKGNFGSGDGVIGIANATTVPSTNPANGGILYVRNGALYYRGGAGTVTLLAPA